MKTLAMRASHLLGPNIICVKGKEFLWFMENREKSDALIFLKRLDLSAFAESIWKLSHLTQ
jgi:hypothetical protein